PTSFSKKTIYYLLRFGLKVGYCRRIEKQKKLSRCIFKYTYVKLNSFIQQIIADIFTTTKLKA
ncbi:hypothetical protein, partial [Campylobacter fetus]|uniref:hypothetical protein n=1 Tax=Campylobacter fetus TaxID=196 RepID=UPI001CA6047E